MKEKSWVVVAPGEMVLQEFDIPAVEKDGLLMRVTTTSICGSDPKYYFGLHNRDKLPIMMGHEVVGVVEEIGEDARKAYGVDKGDRILIEPYRNCGHCDFCREGYYNLCRNVHIWGCNMSVNEGKHLNGGYGQYMYLEPGTHLFKVADGVSDDAAVFGSVVGNGFRMMKTKGQVKPTDTVIIWGPGALGLCGLVAAKELGAKKIIVIGLRKDEIRLNLALEFGADHILFSDEQDVIAEISRLTDGHMGDVVVECTGYAPIYNDVIESVRPTGCLVLIGLNGKQDNGMWTDKIVQREITVKGCIGQPYNCEDAMEVINRGTYPLEKMATHVFPMSRADEAFRFSISGDPSLIRVVMKNNEEW